MMVEMMIMMVVIMTKMTKTYIQMLWFMNKKMDLFWGLIQAVPSNFWRNSEGDWGGWSSFLLWKMGRLGSKFFQKIIHFCGYRGPIPKRVFAVFLIFLFLFGDDVQCLGRLGLTQIMGGGTSCQMGGLRLDHWDRIHSHLIEYPHSISMLRFDHLDRIRSHLIEWG